MDESDKLTATSLSQSKKLTPAVWASICIDWFSALRLGAVTGLNLAAITWSPECYCSPIMGLLCCECVYVCVRETHILYVLVHPIKVSLIQSCPQITHLPSQVWAPGLNYAQTLTPTHKHLPVRHAHTQTPTGHFFPTPLSVTRPLSPCGLCSLRSEKQLSFCPPAPPLITSPPCGLPRVFSQSIAPYRRCMQTWKAINCVSVLLQNIHSVGVWQHLHHQNFTLLEENLLLCCFMGPNEAEVVTYAVDNKDLCVCVCAEHHGCAYA